MALTTDAYCDLTGAETDTPLSALLASDGSRCTLIRVAGASTILSAGEAADQLLLRLGPALSQSLREPGHSLSVSFERHGNTGALADRIESVFTARARAKGLDLAALTGEAMDIVRRQAMAETVLIACWTHPEAAPRPERVAAVAARKKRLAALGPLAPGVEPTLRLTCLDPFHAAFVAQVCDALGQCGLLHDILGPRTTAGESRDPIRDDLTEISRGILFHETPDDWRPMPPASNAWFRPSASGVETNAAGFFAPPLSHLLMGFSAMTWRDHKALRVLGRTYATAAVTLFPRTPLPAFNRIPAALARQGGTRMPWRVVLHLRGGPVRAGFRKFLAGILSWASPANANVFKAIGRIEAMERDDELVFAAARLIAATWIEPGEPADLLPLRHAALATALRTWGGASDGGQVALATADPLRALTETVPGLVVNPVTAPAATAPVAEIVQSLPLDRPAPLFEEGESVLLDRDGKPVFLQSLSDEMQYWLILIYAVPGSGKSVLLNRLNLDFAAYAAGARLPFIGLIEKGVSSIGMVQALTEALPPERRGEIAHIRLQNAARHAVNVFDLGLGRRTPLSREKEFVRNFLATLLGFGDKDGLLLIDRLLNRVWRAKSDLDISGRPALWQPGLDPDLDEACGRLGITLNEGTPYWSLCDALVLRGEAGLAIRAQRYATPTLEDLVGLLSLDETRTDHGEQICKQARITVETAIDRYPIFARHTRLDLGEARISAIDLNDVLLSPVSAEAERHNALMFMAARELFLRRIAGHDEEIPRMDLPRDPVLRQAYVEHWRRRHADMAETPKRICMDEYHVTGGGPGIAGQVFADAREGRKWNLEIVLASQLLRDFGPLKDFASMVFVLSPGDAGLIDEAGTVFGFSDAVQDVMRRDLVKPDGARGANLLAKIKTGDGERWLVLNNRLGPRLLWALTSKARDRQLRDALCRFLPFDQALALLAERFPEGTAAEAWRQALDAASADEASVAERLALSLLPDWRRRFHAGVEV